MWTFFLKIMTERWQNWVTYVRETQMSFHISLLHPDVSSSHSAISSPLHHHPPPLPFPLSQPNNPLHSLLFLLQRSVWVRWRSAVPSCRATFRAWCSDATNAPSHAPATRRCSCTCRSTPRSNPTSASSAIMTAVDGASLRSIYASSTRSAWVHGTMVTTIFKLTHCM